MSSIQTIQMVSIVESLSEDKLSTEDRTSKICRHKVKVTCSTSSVSSRDIYENDTFLHDVPDDVFEENETDILERMEHITFLLKRSRDMLSQHGIEKFPDIVRQTKAMICRLQRQQSSYSLFDGQGPSNTKVTTWLNNVESNIESECHGLQANPLFGVAYVPRVSKSDTCIVLGKRKKDATDDDDDDDESNTRIVKKSRSETRVVPLRKFKSPKRAKR